MFLSLVLVSAILGVFFYYFRKNDRTWECLRDIPQPPSYPIVGNFFGVAFAPDKMFIEDRKRNYKYFPIYKLNICSVWCVSLLSPDDVELVLGDTKQNNKSRIYGLLHAWLGTGLLTSGGAKWQSRRKILTPAFHFNILQEFINVFVKETETLVEDLGRDCHKDYIDVVVPITQFTLLSIGETAMGINLNNYKNAQKNYKEAIYDLGHLLTQRLLRPWLSSDIVYSLTRNGKTAKKLVKTLHEFSSNVINDRKKNFSSDSYSTRKRLAMLDLLLKYKSEGANIDDEGIREEVDTFMFEGHDTTSMAICYSLLVLANEQKAQEEIFEEIQQVIGDEKPNYSNLNELKYMERCIKEILRLYPSVPFISRVTGSEIETKSGYTIPEDCIVNIYIYDLHHNPNVWPDPEKFDPDRFLPENIAKRHPFAFLPFSAGSRNCIGQKFAMLEMKTALVGILKKFVLVPVDKREDIVFLADLVLRPKNEVKVKFVPRN